MLARYMLSSCVRPSVCPSNTSIVPKRLNIGSRKQLHTSWLRAIIIPVFKKGSAAIATNYRPISLTCVASKIMERIVAKALLEHLVENDLLSSAQHGFLKGKSTCTNLLESYNDWTLCLWVYIAVSS